MLPKTGETRESVTDLPRPVVANYHFSLIVEDIADLFDFKEERIAYGHLSCLPSSRI